MRDEQRSTNWSGSERSPRRWPTRAARPSLRLGATATDGRAEFGTAGTGSPSAASCSPTRRAATRPCDAEERAPPAAAHRGRAPSRHRARARVALDDAALALHRGEPCAGARGARHRPPLDLRRDHRHDPGPRLRARKGRRSSRPSSPSRSRSCSSGTSGASSTTSSPR